MKFKNIVMCATLLCLPLKTQNDTTKYKEDIYNNFLDKKNNTTNYIFPVADILSKSNKFRHDIFQEDLFKENAEYFTGSISFNKTINTERTEENPFPRTIEPLEMDLKQENLRKSERDAFLKLRENVNQHRDRYHNGELQDDDITRQELKDLNKGVYVLINPNNDGFDHNDSLIHNPQLIIIINESERTITKIPVSLGRYGVRENNISQGFTPSGNFSIQTSFGVKESLIAGRETEPSTYLDAVHSWVDSKGSGSYKLSKDYYEQQGATMVKGLITIGSKLQDISITNSEGNISWKRGIFIHGSNSLKDQTFGKPASNGCIRMHPANRDILNEKIIFGTPYKIVDGVRVLLEDMGKDTSNRNNKLIFEKIQRHNQEYFFTAGSHLYIMD